MSNENFSICYLGDLIYILSEDGSNSVLIINKTSGIANVLSIDDEFAYKGATIKTSKDCCSVGILAKDMIFGLRKTLEAISPFVTNPLTKPIYDNLIDKIFGNPRDTISLSFSLGTALNGGLVYIGTALAPIFTIVTIAATIQAITVMAKNVFVDKEDWHSLYDTITFSRPGLLQNKKIYNIPNDNGGYDYIEVEVKEDLSLDRDNALYISEGNVRHMTRAETYEYFESESWTLFAIPTKYMHSSWQEILG